MAKIFILFENSTDDLSSLPKDAELVPLFKFIHGAPNIPHIQARLTDILDGSDPVLDRIVFNGPSYLTALAGYIWFTNEKRTAVNFYAFSIKDNKYIEHTEPIA
jgi:hypothetical protein